jgi:hypothetical protein
MLRSKFVLQETARCQGVEVEKKPSGKVDKISCTCLLVRVGAFGPALRTGARDRKASNRIADGAHLF